MSGIRKAHRIHNPILTFRDEENLEQRVDLREMSREKILEFKRSLESDASYIQQNLRPEGEALRFRQEKAMKVRRRLANVCDHELSHRKKESSANDRYEHFYKAAKSILDKQEFDRIVLESKKLQEEALNALFAEQEKLNSIKER